MTAQILAPKETAKLTPNFGLIEKTLRQTRKPEFWAEVERAEGIIFGHFIGSWSFQMRRRKQG
jgi:hypothetical protein